MKSKAKKKKFIASVFRSFTALALALALCVGAAQPTEAATYKSWKSAYKAVLKDWTIIEDLSSFSDEAEYLESYFGDDYKFNKYFVYNLDKKGAPELFLYSSTMGLTAVFTYKNGKLKFLMADDIFGINKSKKSIIVKGHWHGAGGTYDKEWSAYRMSSTTKIKQLFYIDKDSSIYAESGGYYVYYKDKYSYTSYNTSGYSASKSKSLYTKLKKTYVNSSTRFSKFKKYKLSSTKGLKS